MYEAIFKKSVLLLFLFLFLFLFVTALGELDSRPGCGEFCGGLEVGTKSPRQR